MKIEVQRFGPHYPELTLLAESQAEAFQLDAIKKALRSVQARFCETTDFSTRESSITFILYNERVYYSHE